MTRAAVIALLALTACAPDRASMLDPNIRYIELTPQQIARQSCLAGLPNCRTSAALLISTTPQCIILIPPPSADDARIITNKNADCYRAKQQQAAGHPVFQP